jgi:hypothetical protein
MNMTAIAIVAIVCWAIVSLTNGRPPSKKQKTANSELESKYEQMQKDLNQMAERLAVLEKIVTDEKYQLNKEFNSL